MSRINYTLRGKRVWVAGHSGMVGSALVRRLATEDCTILTARRDALDLTQSEAVQAWMAAFRPDCIFNAAAKVGGIGANTSQPAAFLYENLMIEANIIEAAHRFGVEKLLFLGSSCIYPKNAAQPVTEDALLTGPLEPTNEWYAIAKIAGVKLCAAYRAQYGCDFISAMPTNLYGPGDNFDLQTSHVIPALLRKAHEARVQNAPAFEIWGTGAALREFLHVDDCADALVCLMQNYSDAAPVNIGAGSEMTIAALSALICKVTGYGGPITYDHSKPDGTPRKLLSGEKMHALNWRPKIELEEGLRALYRWYLQHEATLRRG